MPGWIEEAPSGDLRMWRNADGDVVSLAARAGPLSLPSLSDPRSLQQSAQDPYEPSYERVDRKVLRFMSDDEAYDEQFPDHPLTKVRRVLATLPGYVRIEGRTLSS